LQKIKQFIKSNRDHHQSTQRPQKPIENFHLNSGKFNQYTTPASPQAPTMGQKTTFPATHPTDSGPSPVDSATPKTYTNVKMSDIERIHRPRNSAPAMAAVHLGKLISHERQEIGKN
jgi:hypothetical protein